MDLKKQLLLWIREDLSAMRSEGRLGGVPVHILLVKTALARLGSNGDSSASVELSLQVFERAAICRVLREAFQEGEIKFVDQLGAVIEVDSKELTLFGSGQPSRVKFVAI